MLHEIFKSSFSVYFIYRYLKSRGKLVLVKYCYSPYQYRSFFRNQNKYLDVFLRIRTNFSEGKI